MTARDPIFCLNNLGAHEMFLRNYFSQLWNGLATRAQEFLSENLPTRPKRALLIAHISGVLYEARHPDESIVHRVNRLLSLAALEANQPQPQVVDRVWRSSEQSPPPQSVQWMLKRKDWNALANHFEQNTPKWLHYGDEETMLRDIEMAVQRYGKTTETV